MISGSDIGYDGQKVIGPFGQFYVPSAVGTVNKARFSLSDKSDDIILDAGEGQRMVGEAAVRQSRFLSRKEDRGWITSTEYKYLMCAGFSEMSTTSRLDLDIVTGLPVAFYKRDKEQLRQVFLGEHRFCREGRSAQVFRVRSCRVIPQPFGTIFSQAINDKGILQDNLYSTRNIGIIDIGGKTTNLLSVKRLEEISDNTGSVSKGAWDAVRAFRAFAESEYPGLEDLKDHQVIQTIISKKQDYYDKVLDLTEPVDAILRPMAEAIISEAGNLWNSGSLINKILITGGGALLLGHYIKQQFPHSVIIEDPVYANARGYYRFGLFSARQS